ncbi:MULTISPECIES: MFS transporter [Pseudonocardia]|uniref:MFS transporter n=1 Tax=Pseudonocardia saturnea TaxID=33909 RepID=A0ABQ0RXI8_9PSEU|nr:MULTISPECIES: MFS transporter [Pseudonocardia]BBG01635.1 MFS transporter [Pseudonocardia autotrophica]GEC25380.1 MFS transporter [Pseudonocardia saturnea]
MNDPDPRRWWALSVCLVAGFMSLLDVSIVNVALPSVQAGLDASAAQVSWVVSGYALTFGLVLVAAGRLGDDRGRRRMFLIGLALFTLTSAAAGLAPTAEVLVVVRLLQGAAAGLISPQVVGFIQDLFRGPERGTAFGLFGTVVAISTAVGPLLGGLLLAWAGDADGWRWVFFVNIPIGLAALLFAARVLPRDRPGPSRRRPLDLPGVLLLGTAVVCLMLPLVLAERDPAAAPWWLLGVSAVALAGFVGWERVAARRHGHPLVDFGLLRIRSYAVGATLGMAYFAGFTSIFFVLTLYLQDGLGYTPLQTGLVLTPFALSSAVTSTVGGRLVARYGQAVVVTGLAVVLAGLLATDIALALTAGGPLTGWVVAGTLLVAGAGGGLVVAPNQTIALSEIPPASGGTAAGVLQTGQRIGTAVGLSVVAAVFFGRLTATGDWASAISHGLVVTVGLVAVALALGVTDLVLSRRRGRAGTTAGEPTHLGGPTGGG